MSEPMPPNADDAAETDGGVVREAGDRRGQTESDADTGGESEPRVCWLDDADADAVIGSLSSETARSILTALYEQERTASELAETVDTSVQNVRHHLDSLAEAELTEVTGTRYSVKGREMDVYGPPDRRTVIAVGSGEEETESLLDSLRSVLGGVAVLVATSLLVQATTAPTGAPRVPDAVGGTTAAPFPPGLLVFVGGIVVAATVLAVRRLQ